MTATETDVWVNDYTTSGGIHVAGHWRRRRSAPDTCGDAGTPATGPDLSSSPPGPAAVSLPWLTAASATARASTTPAPVTLDAAEARYRAAQVAVGVSTLKRRRGEASDLEAALRERAAARAALEATRQAHHHNTTTPSVEHPVEEAAPPATDGHQDRCAQCGQFRSAEHECPPPAELPAANYATVKGDERVKMMVADLEQSVQAIVESGQLQRWLDAMASNGLHRWSGNNRLLAVMQMVQRGKSLEDLDGLHMMGFRQWETLNRKVSKGAKAVWILAPITRKVAETDDHGEETLRSRVVGFKAVPVFDVSDTNGEPLAEHPGRPAPGTATPGTLEGLRERVGAAGYSYEEVEIPGCQPATGKGTLGFTEPASKRIVVDARLSDAQKASTIAHELGHVHCGHVDDLGEYRHHRGRMETEAEMTAYLVNRSRGMSRDQVDAFSPAYIAGWSKGDAAVMHAAMDKASRAYSTIIEGEWPGPKGT